MSDSKKYSEKLLKNQEANNPAALARIGLAKKRIQSILDREIVAHQKTLEQKISEQGPEPQRVDPHLVGLAIMDLLELNRLRPHAHPKTQGKPWYSNILTPQTAINQKLEELAPLYAKVSGSEFGNLTGDALEVVVYKCLEMTRLARPRYAYQGFFLLNEPKNAQNRYTKRQPPKTVNSSSTSKEADFIQFGYEQGGLCIECKNYREWIYPHHGIIKELIVKSAALDLIPVLIARRIHYTTLTNFFVPAGIIAHESYYQYYPSDESTVASLVSNKRSLGFTDVKATEVPHKRTIKFILETLNEIVPYMAERWNANKHNLLLYANGEINLAQLYTKIGSRAGGKWQSFEDGEIEEYISELQQFEEGMDDDFLN